MQTTKEKTTMNLRLLSFLIALSMVFSVSIEGLAGSGDGSGGGTGGAGIQKNMAGPSGFQIRLSDPDTEMTNAGGTYVLTDTYDATREIVFGFSLNPNGQQRGFGIKDFTGVKIYAKTDPEKTAIVSLGQNTNADNINPVFYFTQNPPTDSEYNDHYEFAAEGSPAFQNEKTTELHIAANTLQSGTTYCLLIPGTSVTYNKDITKTLGVDVIIEFSTVDSVPAMTLTSSLGDALTSTSRTTLKVEGGKTGYQYRFKIKNNDNNNVWMAQDFSTKNSVVWMAGPKGAVNGKTITVDVKDAQGKQIATLQKTVSVTDVTPLKIDSLTSSKGTTLGYKTRTVLSAEASGGVAPYQYQFTIKNNDTGKTWTAQTFKESNSVVWLAGPQGAAKGKTVTVEVKDATGQIVKKTLDVAVSNSDLEVVSVKSSAGNNLKASDYTNLTATVKGGTAPYSYRFWIRNNDTGKEWTAQQFTENKNTCRWYAGPSGATKGKTVFVDVEDAKGNIVTETLDVSVK